MPLDNPTVVYAVVIEAYDTRIGAATALYAISTFASGLNTTADDDPASQEFDRSFHSLSASQWAYGPGRISGEPQMPTGTLRLINADGRLDRCKDWVFADKRVRGWRGDDGNPFSAYESALLARVVGQPSDGAIGDGVKTLDFTFVPEAYVLDQPLQRRLFAGTGGDEGGSEIEGLEKPIGCGIVANAVPVIINNSTNERQYHDGRTQGTRAAWDGAISDTGIFDDVLSSFVPGAEPDEEQTIDFYGDTVQNETSQRRDLTNASWTKASTSAARIAGVDGVDGGGSRLTATAANGTATLTIAGMAGLACILWLFVRRARGSGTIEIRFDGVTYQTLPVSAEWSLVYFYVTGPTEFRFRIVTSGDAIDVDFCECQTPASLFPTEPEYSDTAATPDFAFSPARVALRLLTRFVGKAAHLDLDMASFAALDQASTIAAPGALTAALAGLGAGNVNSGTHSYKATFVDRRGGETEAGTVSNTVTTSGGNGQVALSAIPTGGLSVTARKIYRTAAGAASTGPWKLLTTINDNTTTTFADNIADGSLGADAPSTSTAPVPIGFFSRGQESVRAAIARVLDSIGAYLFGDLATGKLGVRQLQAPADTPDVQLYEAVAIGEQDWGGNVHDCRRVWSAPVLWRLVLGYARNETVQKTGLDAAASSARKQFVFEEWRTTSPVEDTDNRDIWGDSALTNVRKNTLLVAKADAETEQQRLFAVFGVPREIIEVDTSLEPGAVALGDTVGVTWRGVTYDRDGTAREKNYVVIGWELIVSSDSGAGHGELLRIQAFG